MTFDFLKSRDSYAEKLEEADRKFNEAERRWRTFKRELSETKWEHDLTMHQQELLRLSPEVLLQDVRRFYHRSEYYAMKVQWYHLRHVGPRPGEPSSGPLSHTVVPDTLFR